MGDGYEINVALNGRHFFATDLRSAYTFEKAETLYKLFTEKFPVTEGYEVSVTRWKTVGEDIKV